MNALTLPTAVAAALLYASNPLMLAAVQQRNPQHDAVRDPVSDYGTGHAASVFKAYGALGTAAAALLALLLWQAGLPPWLVWLQVGVVAARIGVVLFRTDLEGAPRSTAGRLHMLFAVASFTLYYVVIDNATPRIAPDALPALAGALTALRTTVAWGLITLVCCLVLPPLRRWFGLAERVFLIAVPVWGLLACLALAAAH